VRGNFDRAVVIAQTEYQGKFILVSASPACSNFTHLLSAGVKDGYLSADAMTVAIPILYFNFNPMA
jgi:hypothetical protein